jgi:hypothetical protein
MSMILVSPYIITVNPDLFLVKQVAKTASFTAVAEVEVS